jgi:hypothetical protein
MVTAARLITIIWKPIGRPLVTSDRMMAKSGISSRHSFGRIIRMEFCR